MRGRKLIHINLCWEMGGPNYCKNGLPYTTLQKRCQWLWRNFAAGRLGGRRGELTPQIWAVQSREEPWRRSLAGKSLLESSFQNPTVCLIFLVGSGRGWNAYQSVLVFGVTTINNDVTSLQQWNLLARDNLIQKVKWPFIHPPVCLIFKSIMGKE